MDSSLHANRLPTWFRIRLSITKKASTVRNIVDRHNLHTVCSSAGCPNRTECWNAGTATFMILGNRCTRTCSFCGVPKGSPENVDSDEPARVGEAVRSLGLRYAVVTSVTRDDLPDGGASLFAATIREIKSRCPDCRVEVLIPDFLGSESALQTVLAARPHVLNHNLETVPSLYPLVRPQADYRRSLELLARASRAGTAVKSGLMLGLGEKREELARTFSDLRETGCSILTLGQYLRPGRSHRRVEKFYRHEEFEELRAIALQAGFCYVTAGPLIRSSYHAEQGYLAIDKT